MDWKGIHKIWQNQAFGKIYAEFTNSRRFIIDNTQVLISNKFLIGNTTLHLYCPFNWKVLNPITSLAKDLNVASIRVYSVDEIPELIKFFQRLSHTFVLDLTISKEKLWNKICPKARNKVRKGKKKGVKVKIAEEEKELIEWWHIYSSASHFREYSNINFPLVQALFREGNLSKLFIALVNGKVVSGFFFLTDDYPMYWAGAHDGYYNEFSPNNVNMWNAIVWFKEKGYKLLDFGGARLNPLSGPTRFKKSFGGDIKTAYIYQIPVSGAKNNAVQMILKTREAIYLVLKKSSRLFHK